MQASSPTTHACWPSTVRYASQVGARGWVLGGTWVGHPGPTSCALTDFLRASISAPVKAQIGVVHSTWVCCLSCRQIFSMQVSNCVSSLRHLRPVCCCCCCPCAACGGADGSTSSDPSTAFLVSDSVAGLWVCVHVCGVANSAVMWSKWHVRKNQPRQSTMHTTPAAVCVVRRPLFLQTLNP